MKPNIFGMMEVDERDKDLLIQNEKDEEYLEYINTHCKNVRKAFNDLYTKVLYSNNIIQEIKDALNDLEKIIDDHDLSKYSDDEFPYYRKEFYPIDKNEKNNNKVDFEKAWNHHFTYNEHHPEHWVKGNGEIEDMPLIYILEMICDWQSFYYVNKGSAKDYWNKNKKEISKNMSMATVAKVNDLVELV